MDDPARRPEEQLLSDLEDFTARHGRLPRASWAGERMLARWVADVYHCRIRVAHETAVRVNAVYDAMAAAWPVGQTDSVLDDLREFVARTGRFPRLDGIVAEMNGGAERSLALWAAAVRKGTVKVSPEIADAVAEVRTNYPPGKRGGKLPRKTS